MRRSPPFSAFEPLLRSILDKWLPFVDNRRETPCGKFLLINGLTNQMKGFLWLIAVVPFLAGTAPAANIISPNAQANVEGGKANALPFNLTGFSPTLANQRYQQVYSARDFGALAPGGEFITSISFRPDAGSGGGAFTSTLPSIRIDLSTTSANPDGLASNFLANAGADSLVVFGATNGSPLALSSGF